MLKKKQRAFTLIELMVTLVVLGVVLAVGIPSFNAQIARNSADGMTEDLLSALNLARSEAVKRGGLVSLCASLNGTNCSTNPNHWIEGFIVTVDATGAVLRAWDGGDRWANADIQIIEALPGTTEVALIRYTNLGTLGPAMPAGGLRVRTKMRDNGQGLNCVLNSAQQLALSAAGTIRPDNTDCWN